MKKECQFTVGPMQPITQLIFNYDVMLRGVVLNVPIDTAALEK